IGTTWPLRAACSTTCTGPHRRAAAEAPLNAGGLPDLAERVGGPRGRREASKLIDPVETPVRQPAVALHPSHNEPCVRVSRCRARTFVARIRCRAGGRTERRNPTLRQGLRRTGRIRCVRCTARVSLHYPPPRNGHTTISSTASNR